MESADLTRLVQQLRAAGEVTRARILALLSRGELSVGELAQVLGQSQPRLSRHMKFLTAAGLVERLPEGAWVFYRLPTEGRSRALVDALVGEIDPDDATVQRDRERLEETRAARSAAAQQYFSRVAGEWDALRALHYSDHDIEQHVLAAAGEGPFDLVVDFGTGTGRMLALFAGRARRVEGIDLSHQMLTVARSNLASVPNASVRHGDAANAPYQDSSASLVIIHQVLHFLDDPGRALVEAARVLKPGGRLVVVDFAPHTLEHLRTDHAHRHLGVAEPDFARWAERAKLKIDDVKHLAAPADGKGVAVTIWTADCEKLSKVGRAA
jgi:ubiquinone/menaquinone biosynthesis C-methylase UbiE/DNA-binding transcriptional ArsR family regulator